MDEMLKQYRRAIMNHVAPGQQESIRKILDNTDKDFVTGIKAELFSDQDRVIIAVPPRDLERTIAWAQRSEVGAAKIQIVGSDQVAARAVSDATTVVINPSQESLDATKIARHLHFATGGRIGGSSSAKEPSSEEGSSWPPGIRAEVACMVMGGQAAGEAIALDELPSPGELLKKINEMRVAAEAKPPASWDSLREAAGEKILELVEYAFSVGERNGAVVAGVEQTADAIAKLALAWREQPLGPDGEVRINASAGDACVAIFSAFQRFTEATTITKQHAALTALSGAVDDMASFLPGWNADTGTIDVGDEE